MNTNHTKPTPSNFLPAQPEAASGADGLPPHLARILVASFGPLAHDWIARRSERMLTDQGSLAKPRSLPVRSHRGKNHASNSGL